jgi:hypothetical protein
VPVDPVARVLVCGDVTVDWDLARKDTGDGAAAWAGSNRVAVARRPGSAALLAELLQELEGVEVRRAGPSLDAPGLVQSYALWRHVREGATGAWRVAEHLGLEVPPGEGPNGEADDGPADVVVVDDAALGFRDDPARWPRALAEPAAGSWVVVKTASPVLQGPLWERLLASEGVHLVAVMTIRDLRHSDVQVSRELSWERTAQDLVWELAYNPRVESLARRATVVVSFGAAGALVMGPGPDGLVADLVFDPAVVEGMWEADHPGAVLGSTVALTAGLVRELVVHGDEADLRRGTLAGLHALRSLHAGGYDAAAEEGNAPLLRFPTTRVAQALAEPAPELSTCRVPDPVAVRGTAGGSWTILRDRHPGPLGGVARRVVIEGVDAALGSVPVGRFGALVTVDRHEIEAFREVRALVAEYAGRRHVSQPLSVAVFGAPGSGKSFGVKQVAAAVVPPSELAVMTFNLAELDTAHDLVAALHEVRDAGLRGRLPLVFWDEFDTAFEGRPRGWLRHFLAPMQDGEFREGQVVHPIGRSVFVFAGGTAATLEEFQAAGDPVAFRDAKGPDFVSRLKGFVNVLGPNPASADDPVHVLRRAILLRSVLKRQAPQLFHRHGGAEVLDIDQGVLRAFLEIPQYRHGARSMESVVTTSRLSGLDAFERSCLPAAEQLDLHVGGAEFLALVDEPELAGEQLERLARAAHEVYCDALRGRGEQTASLRPWEELDEGVRESNRANVQDIPAKLARIGAVLVTARGDERAFAFSAEEVEVLARAEHERWVLRQERLVADGAADRPELQRPWDELAEQEREKDRDLVRGIPAILAHSGHAVLRVRAAAG